MPQQILWEVEGSDLSLNCNEDSEECWRIRRAGFRVRFRSELVVYVTDHRRIVRARARKTFHSILRCALLYSEL
jgi:hypothetical protein